MTVIEAPMMPVVAARRIEMNTTASPSPPVTRAIRWAAERPP